MDLRDVHLEDKYTVEDGGIYLTGTQALVKLPLMQRAYDARQGLNTAGFISGYRGSPLGGYDQALWQAKKFLTENDIEFVPGINEDLGATAVWGSQQAALFPGCRHQGIFGIWYGKGPGVDRTGDVFKHANAAGSSQFGGVLALAGDDHSCKSSTLPHQSEYAYMDASIPNLVPSNVQDILDLGLYGWALSRYSGCWVGFKVIADTIDTSASVEVSPNRIKIITPDDFIMPAGGLNIRWPDAPLEQEKRLRLYKLEAAKAFVRANGLDKHIFATKKPRFGIVTCGKSYHDVRQALDDLGLDEKACQDLGIDLYKVAMNWPLEPQGILKFAKGLEEIFVVEEKRPVMEAQIRDLLYGLPDKDRPKVIGKVDEKGQLLLPEIYELNVPQIALALGQRILAFHESESLAQKVAHLENLMNEKKKEADLLRLPFYCSGCPHNTSTTHLPEGSRAVAGIGCHYMATWIAHNTSTFTQMGGEGVPWIGQAPFTDEPHIFANLGDGTYFHSGILAVRAAVSAKVNITFKILYNDAVAMTGGQHVDGELTVPMITQQMHAEGVRKIVIVTDEPDKYLAGSQFAPGVTIHHRDELDSIQEDIRKWPGVSVLIYDQTCAAEKRRRRKRGLMVDPPKRAFINERVCEGCGDCSLKSNCVSVQPIETALGRKRKIDQSSCNKDFSCVNGFCPSFVTVEGGKLRKVKSSSNTLHHLEDLPDPTLPALEKPFSIYLTGVGGTGVVTIGALIGMAAHLEKKGCAIVDMAGLAQKGGAVVSHIRIAQKPTDIHATRVSREGADLLLGCDIVVAAGPDALGIIKIGHTYGIINEDQTITGHFINNPDYDFKHGKLRQNLVEKLGKDHTSFIDATHLATRLMGDAIATNLFVLGYAYQKGLVPVHHESLIKAIELNNVAIDMNKLAFNWGRYAAINLAAVQKAAHIEFEEKLGDIPHGLEEIIGHRKKFLTGYQNKAYADHYENLVRLVEKEDLKHGKSALSQAVAKYYAKLLAYKDEYEVARLYTDGTYLKELFDQFEGDVKLKFHLAPPLLSRKDPKTGELKKDTYGPWVFKVFKILAKLKGLRGTAFDIFGYTHERKMERALIKDYEDLVQSMLNALTNDNYDLAVELASLPERIRGFGHVKERHLKDVKANETALKAKFFRAG